MNDKNSKVGESFQEFEADDKRLVRLAYFDVPVTFQDRLAAKTFINGIRALEVKKILQIFRC